MVKDEGGSGNNFRVTTFDDEASTSVTVASAPFNGSYKPESPLSAFDGSSTLGKWKLYVNDDSSSDIGTLHSWSLAITREMP